MLPVYKIEPDEREEISLAASKLSEQLSSADIDLFSMIVARTARDLPSGVLEWRNTVQVWGCGLLKGLPITSELPGTPRSRDEFNRPIDNADLVCGLITSLFGRIFQYEGKVDPCAIQNVFYVPGHEELQLGSGTQPLEWHVEDGFHLHRPNWVGLMCIRGDQLTTTYLARARDLPLCGVYGLMESHNFLLRVDDSFGESLRSTTVSTTTLRHDNNGVNVIFDPAFTDVRNVEERELLNKISDEFDKIRVEVTLEAGDMLIFDNRTVVHGRSKYRPKEIGTDRWLKRALAVSTETYARHATHGRIPIALIS